VSPTIRLRLELAPRALCCVWLGLFGAMSQAHAAECAIKDFFAQEPDRSGPKVVPPFAVRATRAPVPRPAMPEDPMAAKRREIMAAIRKGDLAALKRALPTDAAPRRDVLRNSWALRWALALGSPAIVRQVREWDPEWVASFTASASQNLTVAARGWWSDDSAARRGYPAPDANTPQEHLKLIVMLLEMGANPAGGQNDWMSPLGLIASVSPSPETTQATRALLEHGATTETSPTEQRSPLSRAAEAQNADVVRLLLQARKPSQRALDEALAYAPIVEANLQALALLLEHGANINLDPEKTHTQSFYFPAWQASVRVKPYGERDLMRLIIRYKADPNRTTGVQPPLMNVMHVPDLMEGLLANGANPNVHNTLGETSLHMAVQAPREVRKSADDGRSLAEIEPGLDPKMRYEAAALLLRYGADPNARTPSGETPLMLTGPDDAATIALLIARGGKLILDDRTLSYYRSYNVPIETWALLKRNEALALELLGGKGLGADDCGAVFYAAQTGAARALATLLDRGAKVNVLSDHTRMTPLLIAAASGQMETAGLLLDRGVAGVNDRTPKAMLNASGHGGWGPMVIGGTTALMAAATYNRRQVAEELLRRGADINAMDYAGSTALRHARNAYANDVVDLLLARGAKE
jgi:ankyrin repeat protein